MFDFLISPGVPFFVFSLMGVLLAAGGLMQMERARLALAGVRSLPARKGMAGRYMLGQFAAFPLAGTLILTAVISGVEGQSYTLLMAGALAIYMYVGVVIPRKPMVQAEKERRRL